jgi:hypothetical protein
MRNDQKKTNGKPAAAKRAAKTSGKEPRSSGCTAGELGEQASGVFGLLFAAGDFQSSAYFATRRIIDFFSTLIKGLFGWGFTLCRRSCCSQPSSSLPSEQAASLPRPLRAAAAVSAGSLVHCF